MMRLFQRILSFNKVDLELGRREDGLVVLFQSHFYGKIAQNLFSRENLCQK